MYASRYHGVTDICTGWLLSTRRAYTKEVIRTLRSDHAGDMHAVNANDTAKVKVPTLHRGRIHPLVPDDDGSPLITRRDLSHRLSSASRECTARVSRRAHLTDTRIIASAGKLVRF